MTAVTPLEFIHRKGIFGDHHKKNEKDLLQISEVKNLTIIQVVQYKRSIIQSNTIQIEGLGFPIENSKVESNQETRILWNAPRTWLIISKKENIINIIKEKCTDENFAITDISHSRAVIQIKGLQAREILKKGCPLNINEFKVNNCANTSYNGINIMIDYINSESKTFNIYSLRSFGGSFYHSITDASLEYGYEGI